MKKLLLSLTLLALCLTAFAAYGLAEGTAPTTATYSVHILAEDWGCVADRVILALDAPIENAVDYTYAVSETRMGLDWTTFEVGPTTAERTIADFYLCDETGAAVDGPSAYVALDLTFSPSEGSPLFSNSAHFGINEWSDPYYMTITMTGPNGDVAVDEAYTARLTDTDMFDFSSFTASDGTEYQTALYTPEQESDTLVVWLHGMGEGGTDILMPLINVDMGALVSDPFQQIMGGAYILVPQCPIYWMDTDGQGSSYVDGGIVNDGTSFYLESLHELIAAYREQIGAKRVIIAGCSNGGFMTMMLAVYYGDEYDAYVPICEALEDRFITDEQIVDLATRSLFFIYAQNDPLVVPSVYEEPTIERLKAAGAADLHVYAPEDVHDTTGRFFDMNGEPVQSFGHGSWQYFFNNDAVDENGVNCWEWMGEHAK